MTRFLHDDMDKTIKQIISIADNFTETAKCDPYKAARMYTEAFEAVDLSDTPHYKADKGGITPPMNELYKGIKD